MSSTRTLSFALLLAAAASIGCQTVPRKADAPSAVGMPAPSTVSTIPTHAEGPDVATRAELQRMLDDVAAMGTGASMTVVVDGQATTLVSGTVREGGDAVVDDTLFNVQSVSKLLTAAKVHALAHAGKLNLDDSLGQHLPGLKLLDHDGNDLAEQVSLRQLLMHRAGLPRQLQMEAITALGLDFEDPMVLTDLSDQVTIPPHGMVGDYSYSNIGYGLLGAVIERVSGCAFAACMQTFCTAELGLSTATFLPASITGSAAHGKLTDPKTGEAEFWPPRAYASRYMLPYGGLWISTPELAQFGETLRLARDDESSPFYAMVHAEGDRGHGMGPVFARRFASVAIEHDGAGPGFLAWLTTIPEKGVTLAIAVNGFDERSLERAKVFRHAVDDMLSVVLEGPGAAN